MKARNDQSRNMSIVNMSTPHSPASLRQRIRLQSLTDILVARHISQPSSNHRLLEMKSQGMPCPCVSDRALCDSFQCNVGQRRHLHVSPRSVFEKCSFSSRDSEKARTRARSYRFSTPLRLHSAEFSQRSNGDGESSQGLSCRLTVLGKHSQGDKLCLRCFCLHLL